MNTALMIIIVICALISLGYCIMLARIEFLRLTVKTGDYVGFYIDNDREHGKVVDVTNDVVTIDFNFNMYKRLRTEIYL